MHDPDDDGDVTVDVLGGNVENTPPVLQNTTPTFISSNIQQLIWFLESYGWFLLIGGILIVYLYNKYKPNVDKWKQQQEEWKDMEVAKKNPDKAYKIQVSMEQARLKLQEKVTIDTENKKEARLKREEEERKMKIEEWEKHQSGSGYHSKSKPMDKKSKDTSTLKPKKKSSNKSDFNALTGSGGGSCSYRPSGRKNMGGGG